MKGVVREEEKAMGEVELEAVQVEVAKDEAAKEVEATEAARAVATRVEGERMADEVADWAEAGKVVVREGETANAPRPERTW